MWSSGESHALVGMFSWPSFVWETWSSSPKNLKRIMAKVQWQQLEQFYLPRLPFCSRRVCCCWGGGCGSFELVGSWLRQGRLYTGLNPVRASVSSAETALDPWRRFQRVHSHNPHIGCGSQVWWHWNHWYSCSCEKPNAQHVWCSFW